MPAPVVAAIYDHIDLESRIGGYEAAALRGTEIEAAYRAVAELVGAKPRNIAFTESATTAFAQALSSIPFAAGDAIVTTRNDYVSNQIQFLALERRFGVNVLRAPDTPEGGVDVEALADVIRHRRPRLVCVTHVPTNSGLVQDVAAVGAACRGSGTIYLVDACQSIGQMPVDVESLGCDFLSATARKFLRGPRGAGFLFASDRVLELGLEPLFIDMHGAEWLDADRYRAVADAKRFETFEFAWSLVLGTGAAARYALELGIEAIQDRVLALAGRLRDTLAAIDGVRVLDRGRKRCGIVSIGLGNRDPAALMTALRARAINTNAQARASALLDYDDKGVAASLRLSPHYYNTDDEIDRAVAAIGEWMGGSPDRH
jgi:selenocysteine lyase/cysteine desulfurase